MSLAAPNPWRNPKIIFTLLLVFLCGSSAGALGLRYRYQRLAAARSAAPAPQRLWKEGGKEISLETFRKELALTEDQAKEVAVVLDDFMKYYHDLQVQLDEVRANGKDRIVSILDAEQKDKFGKMMSDLQARQIR